MDERKFYSIKEIGILLVLLLVVLGAWLSYYKSKLAPAGAPVMVQIKEGGQITYQSPLEVDSVFIMHQNPNVLLETKAGAARFVQSDCRDQICVNQGWQSRAGQSAACLPNQVLLEIISVEGTTGGVDIVA